MPLRADSYILYQVSTFSRFEGDWCKLGFGFNVPVSVNNRKNYRCLMTSNVDTKNKKKET